MRCNYSDHVIGTIGSGAGWYHLSSQPILKELSFSYNFKTPYHVQSYNLCYHESTNKWWQPFMVFLKACLTLRVNFRGVSPVLTFLGSELCSLAVLISCSYFIPRNVSNFTDNFISIIIPVLLLSRCLNFQTNLSIHSISFITGSLTLKISTYHLGQIAGCQHRQL